MVLLLGVCELFFVHEQESGLFWGFDALGFGDGDGEVGGSSSVEGALCRLAVFVEFPMTGRMGIG